METTQIPLSLLGVKGFNYTKNDLTNSIYYPEKQISSNFFELQMGRDTVSSLSTTSGWGLLDSHDDEERGVDD